MARRSVPPALEADDGDRVREALPPQATATNASPARSAALAAERRLVRNVTRTEYPYAQAVSIAL
jgi:hypothetical protein